MIAHLYIHILAGAENPKPLISGSRNCGRFYIGLQLTSSVILLLSGASPALCPSLLLKFRDFLCCKTPHFSQLREKVPKICQTDVATCNKICHKKIDYARTLYSKNQHLETLL